MKLKPYQLEGVAKITQFGGRAILADEMGLGKTAQALFWIKNQRKEEPGTVCVVCPASVKYHWKWEASRFGIQAQVLEGKLSHDLTGDFFILNYDILSDWLPVLRAKDLKYVVLDEAHYCKNLSAKRTRAVFQLVQRVPYVLALTGTPLTNRPIELWPVLKAVRPDLFPSRTKFAWRYCKPRWTPWGWSYDGSANLDELHRILFSTCMIRRTKKDVLSELPSKSRKVVFTELPDMETYYQAQRNFLQWLASLDPERARRAARAQALAKVGYLMRLVAELKLPWVKQWISDFLESNPDEKLVCFTSHTFVVDALKERFKSKCVVIDGRVRGDIRHETVRRFNSDPRVRLLIGQWVAAGVGINLAASHYAVALDLPWTPGDLVQAEDRIHRIGQSRDCYVFYLIAKGTIEEKQIKLLRRKAEILDEVLSGKRRRDFNIFNELLRQMEIIF
jgi:SWI/SNF-related matrix-associated actin-dependent regulator 1 of chromatin subfamily A